MVDTKAFRNLSYGLYIISSKKDGKSVGCVVNTFSQVTSTPAQVTVARKTTLRKESKKQVPMKLQ